MLPTPRNYSMWPSVVLSDKLTEMTVVPNEKAFLFFEGEEYKLTLIPVNSDVLDYHAPLNRSTVTVVAHGGVLKFEYTFTGEQEYLVILEYGEKKLQEFNLYAVREDLYALRPLKGDLHAHSYRSDGRRDPAALAGHFREQGYDFFALTDHNRYYPGGEIDETYQGVKLGLCHVSGEEVHTPGSVVHIVHVGGKKSVDEQYIKDTEGYEKAVDEEYLPNVPANVPEPFKRRYAMAMWACDRIHEAGGLAIFAHPFWRPGGSRVYNVCEEYAKLLLMSGKFDTYELVGGMGQAGVNVSVAMWMDLRMEGLKVSVVGSSDVHGLEKARDFPDHFTVCFAEKNENDSIIDAIRNGNSVAVEGTGTEYERHYRCYGSMRLVSYAQYLLKYYFPNLQRICQGEGIAMRSYAMGEADASLIEAQVAQTERFVGLFFGRTAPALPKADVIAFEDKWRAIHLQGPTTKGSHLTAETVTRQI